MTDLETYIDQTAALMNLDLPDAYRQGVVENFGRLAAMAAPIMALDLADDIGPITQFEPGRG
jgi:hypothetical protein